MKVSKDYIETTSEATRNKISVSDDTFRLIVVFVCLLIIVIVLGLNLDCLAC